jgi:hypothetical protein
MQQLNQLIAQLGVTANKVNVSIGGGAGKAANSVKGLDSAVVGLTQSLASMGIVRAFKEILAITSEFQTARISIEAMASSAEIAGAAFTGLIQIAKKTGTEIKGLAAEWIRLRSAGFTEYEATKLTDITATVAKIRGGGELLIYQLTKAFADIKSKGKVNAQEVFRQFGEAGIPAARMLAEAMSKELKRSVSEVELTKLMEQGRINAEAALRVLQEGLSKMVDPAKLQELQRTVFSERWKLFAFNIDLAAAALGKELSPNAIKAVDNLQKLLNVVVNLAPELMKLPQPVKDVAVAVGILAVALTGLGGAMTLLSAAGAGKFWPLLGRFSIIIAAAAAAKELDTYIRNWQAEKGPIVKLPTDKIPEGIRKWAHEIDQFLSPDAINRWINGWTKLEGKLTETPPALALSGELQKVILLEKQIQDLSAKYLAAALPVEALRTMGDPKSLGAEDLKLYITALEAQLKKLEELGPKILDVDKAAIEHARQAARALLSAAKGRAEELIGSPVAKLMYRYQERIETSLVDAEAQLTTFRALALEIEHEIGKEQYENDKRQREADLDQVQRVKEIATLQIEAAGIGNDSLERRLVIIKAVADEQEAAIKNAAELRRVADEADFKREEKRIKLAIEETKLRLPLLAPEAQEAALQAIDFAEKALLQSQMTVEANAIRVATNTAQQIEMIRLQANRETNEAILQQSRDMYGEIRDVVGQFFDAFTDRSQSIFRAVTNTMKSLFLGAMKDIVTSRVAAAFYGMLGRGQVTYGGTAYEQLRGRVPIFGNAVPLPLVNKEIVTSNLQAANRFDTSVDAYGQATVLFAKTVERLSSQGSADRVDTRDVIADAIEEASAKTGVEATLLESVARVESNLRANAVSPKGAKGLMQLMPATMQDWGITNPFDPGQSAMGGASQLRRLLNRYGNLPAALAAYNMGPAAYDRAIKRGRPLPAETQDYVRKVQKLMGMSGPAPWYGPRQPAPWYGPLQPVTLDDLAGLPSINRAAGLGGYPARTAAPGPSLGELAGLPNLMTGTWGMPLPMQRMPSLDELAGLPVTRHPVMTGGLWGLGQRQPSQWSQQIQQLKASFNIGKPVTVPGPLGGMVQIPWASATPREKLGAIMGSKGMASAMAAVGTPVMMAGMQRGGWSGLAMGVGGGMMTGWGLAKTFGAKHPVGGLMAGAGLGIMAASWKKGGAWGVLGSTAGGALTGAGIGMMFGGPLGAAIGAGIGAAVGLGVGITRLFIKTQDEKIRAAIKQVYGIDIPDANIRKQIAEIAKQQYGGNIAVAVRSAEVQELVRLYSLSTGQMANMPRPMYGVTMAQSGGGLQTQPVYNNGQLVQSPYVGTTTTQWATQGLYMQLNPQQATSLFSGQVVNVMQENPATVAQANAAATRAGSSRNDLRGSLLEPSTVMA